MLKGFLVDETTYNLVYNVTRQINVRTSDLSGYMMDGTYVSDVVGTYVQYNVTMAVPMGEEADYESLFAVLKDGDEHSFWLPFGNSFRAVKGRVTGLQDAFVRTEGNVGVWRAIRFSVTSNEAE